MRKIDKCRPLSYAVLAALLFCSHTLVAAQEDGETVKTRAGLIRGVPRSTIITYLGIPYAEPPTGDLRWRPPLPRGRWNGVLEAEKFGTHCPQPTDSVRRRSDSSEDCLFLNVFVPRRRPEGASGSRSSARPVMVWIHGGGNGSGASQLYDPTPLVETGDGVIVVTLNYRVGLFGFLAHPALESEGHAAVNYGILDQQLALKWVRENIENFDGNARNITIFGESSGGLNVMTHIVSPLSTGLFDRAIIQSGAYELDTPSLAASEALGISFAARVGCENQTSKCLRALTTAAILADYAGRSDQLVAAFNQSTVDGKILVESQRSSLEAGRFNRVPVLQGSNSNEARSFTSRQMTIGEHMETLESFLRLVRKDPSLAFAIYSLENFPNAFEAASAAVGDRHFACNAQLSNRLLSKWVPTYAYEFDDAGSSALGAVHAAELKYLFNVHLSDVTGLNADIVALVDGGPAMLSAASRELADAMRMAWIAFAESGSPKSTKFRDWPLALDGIQLLNPSLTTHTTNLEFRARHRCAFWN